MLAGILSAPKDSALIIRTKWRQGAERSSTIGSGPKVPHEVAPLDRACEVLNHETCTDHSAR